MAEPSSVSHHVAGAVLEAGTTPKGPGSKQQLLFFFFFCKLVVMVELCHSQNLYVEVLTPSTSERDLIWKTGFVADVIS